MKPWCAWVGLAAALLPLLGHAADAPPGAPAQERERIRTERAAVEQRYQAALAACGDRFAVTDCTDAARAERRAAVERLARQQGVLDDAERRSRAAQRMRRIEDKMREADQRGEAAPRVALPAAPGASAARPVPPRQITRAAAAAPRASEAGDREAAARAAAAQRRAREAQAHREAVEQRNAQRASRKPPAAGLPTPPASTP